jgi:quinol monooxygenase YgiN
MTHLFGELQTSFTDLEFSKPDINHSDRLLRKNRRIAKDQLLDVFRSAKMIFKWLRRPLTLKPKPQNKKSMRSATVALLVKLEAKPGKEKEVEAFLRGALPLVQEEPETVAWFAIRMDKSTFGIVDAFPSDEGRQAHLSGKVAAALMAKASELFATPPAIEKVDVLAAKLP